MCMCVLSVCSPFLAAVSTAKQCCTTCMSLSRQRNTDLCAQNSYVFCSGTLSYIFNSFGDGRPFSEVVADAKNNGFTEPDPRDDLNGTDVARKVGGAPADLCSMSLLLLPFVCSCVLFISVTC